jgi:hypothetical protein
MICFGQWDGSAHVFFFFLGLPPLPWEQTQAKPAGGPEIMRNTVKWFQQSQGHSNLVSTS